MENGIEGPKTVLVSGAAGRLGRALVPLLLARGYSLRVIAKNEHEARSLPYARAKNFKVIEADLSIFNNARHIAKLAGGCKYAVNAAGLVSFVADDDELLKKANVDASKTFFEACRIAGVKKAVHVSSTSVYGKPEFLPVTEEHPLQPASRYGETKLEGEMVAQKCGLPCVIVRPCPVYGSTFAAQYEKFAKLLKSGDARLLGDGNNRMALVHAKDVANAIECGLQSSVQSGAFNVAGDEVLTQKQFYSIAAGLLHCPIPTKSVPLFLAYSMAGWSSFKAGILHTRPSMSAEEIASIGEDRVFSIEKAKRQLGWTPKVSASAGFKEMLTAMKKA